MCLDGYICGILPRSDMESLKLGVVGVVLYPPMTSGGPRAAHQNDVYWAPCTPLRPFLAVVIALPQSTATDTSGVFTVRYHRPAFRCAQPVGAVNRTTNPITAMIMNMPMR